MQSKINDYSDIIFEGIPYDQFIDIKGKDEFSSATWKDGPLLWDKKKYIRNSNKPVTLICSDNSQNMITSEYLNEVCNFFINLI